MINAIVPIRDSTDQAPGVAMAKSLASTIEVSVDLITVIDDERGPGPPDEALARATLFLKQQASEFPDCTKVRQLSHVGEPADEILNAASEVPGSFLVLSPRWAGEPRSFMPDSLTEHLIREARVPVLLATTDQWPRALSMDNIMVPVTRTWPDASQLLELSHMIGRPQTVFRLVYIVGVSQPEFSSSGNAPPPRGGPPEEFAGYQARWRMMKLANNLRSHGIRSTWELRYGEPSEELSRVATTVDANLIVFHGKVMDAYSAEPGNGIVLRVSHNAATPVLMIPPHYQWPSTRRETPDQSDTVPHR